MHDWCVWRIAADGNEGGRHNLITAAVGNGNLYICQVGPFNTSPATFYVGGNAIDPHSVIAAWRQVVSWGPFWTWHGNKPVVATRRVHTS